MLTCAGASLTCLAPRLARLLRSLCRVLLRDERATQEGAQEVLRDLRTALEEELGGRSGSHTAKAVRLVCNRPREGRPTIVTRWLLYAGDTVPHAAGSTGAHGMVF